MNALTRHVSPYWKKRVLDLGLGKAEYTRFVVLGRSRVGSNLLRNLLNAHPQVIAFGEVFRDPANLDWDHRGYFQSRSIGSLVQRDPLRFLETRLFGRYPADIGAAGFKLFYYHARDAGFAGVWPYLQKRRDLRVIHLKRRNVLQTHLSRKRAAMTDRWVNTSGLVEGPAVIHLDYEECLKDFEQTRAWEESCDQAFASHQVLQVQYEQLADDHRSEMERIQAFLGVPLKQVNPSTFRQTRQRLSDTIANYAELRTRFSGTAWADCFTE